LKEGEQDAVREVINMLIEYINKAMSRAVYEKLEDGSYSGKIQECPGVLAFGKTLYQCQEELRSVLEGWLIVKIRHGDKLPVMGRINLNSRVPVLKEAPAHGKMGAL
jgi:predicted RNase H-like HicB family nuclease